MWRLSVDRCLPWLCHLALRCAFGRTVVQRQASTIAKHEPRPTTDCNSIWCRSNSTARLAMNNPSPSPSDAPGQGDEKPQRVFRDAPTECQCPCRGPRYERGHPRRRRPRTTRPPGAVNFTAFRTRFSSALPSRTGSLAITARVGITRSSTRRSKANSATFWPSTANRAPSRTGTYSTRPVC